MASPSTGPTPHQNPYRDPFYLSATDMPGLPLSTEKLKDDSNYDIWSRQVKNQLIGKNKWGYVDGSFPRPKKDAEKQAMWDQNHSALVSWFEKSVDREHAVYVTRINDVRKTWDTFKLRFGRLTSTQRYNLRQKQCENRFFGGSVTDYYTTLSNLWLEIQMVEPPVRCKCGGCTCRVNERLEDHTAEHNLMDFLLGLPEAFQNFRTNILSKEPLPSVDNAFNLAKEDEHQHRNKESEYKAQEGVLLAASFHDHTSPNQSSSSIVGSAPKTDSKGKPVCSHCHKSGHTRDKCYRLVGFPPGWVPKGRGKQGSSQALQVQAQSGGDCTLQNAESTPTGVGNFAGFLAGTGQPLSQHHGPPMPHAYYMGLGPVAGTQGLHGFGPQMGYNPHITHGPPGLTHDQGVNSAPSPAFAGLTMQPMGQATHTPAYTMEQLHRMMEQFQTWPPSETSYAEGRFAGPFDWAGDRTG